MLWSRVVAWIASQSSSNVRRRADCAVGALYEDGSLLRDSRESELPFPLQSRTRSPFGKLRVDPDGSCAGRRRRFLEFCPAHGPVQGPSVR